MDKRESKKGIFVSSRHTPYVSLEGVASSQTITLMYRLYQFSAVANACNWIIDAIFTQHHTKMSRPNIHWACPLAHPQRPTCLTKKVLCNFNHIIIARWGKPGWKLKESGEDHITCTCHEQKVTPFLWHKFGLSAIITLISAHNRKIYCIGLNWAHELYGFCSGNVGEA